MALRGGVPPERIALHGNNKSDAEIDRALRAGIGRIVIDSLSEIDRLADAAGRLGVRAPVLLRVTVGVEAHTHEYIATAHEDQKFGISLAAGAAAEAVRRVLARPELELRGLHSHIGSQIFDTGGFEVAARRLLGLHAQVVREHGAGAARARPGRRLRHRLHQRARPAAARRRWPTRWPRSSAGSAGPWAWRCPGCRWSRAGPSPGRAPSRCTGAGTIKDVAAGARRWSAATSRWTAG